MAIAPVITRIAISRDEYSDVRKAAIDAGLTTADYLALAVRRQLVAANIVKGKGTSK